MTTIGKRLIKEAKEAKQLAQEVNPSPAGGQPMTDIPDDVLEAARAAVKEYKGSDPEKRQIEAVAQAILAERERCAKVIEGKSHDGIRGSWWHEKFARMADEIRKGPTA